MLMMEEGSLVGICLTFFEAIDVELTNEGAVLGMSEVER